MHWTPLHRAVALSSRQPCFNLSLLQQELCNINALDKWGRTPLIWACGRGDSNAVEVLLQCRADLRIADVEGNSALHLACSSGNVDCVTVLLRSGASVHVKNRFKQTPLHFVKESSVHMLELLVAYGADPNSQDLYGNTPVHIAARYNRAAIIEQLFRVDADITIAAGRGRLPIHTAVESNSPDALQVLLDLAPTHLNGSHPAYGDHTTQGISFTSLGHRCAPSVSPPPATPKRAPSMRGQGSAMQREIACITLLDHDGLNILHIAALWAGLEVMQILSGTNLQGVDPSLRSQQGGDTPDDCFYNHRNKCCTVIRSPFEEEQRVWRTLMASARRQNRRPMGEEDDLADAGTPRDVLKSGSNDWLDGDNDDRNDDTSSLAADGGDVEYAAKLNG